jgi:hypothetical protein
MSNKRFIGWALGIAAVLFGSYLSVCVVIDPFNLFHPISPDRYVSNEERLSKWAIAHSPEFDSYFIGGSMNQEFLIPEFNRIFGAHFANLSLNGATSYEELNMLKQIPPKHLKVLVLDVFYMAYMAESNAPKYPDYPYYLYDTQRHNYFEAYLVFNSFLLRELYYAYCRNFRGVYKIEQYFRMSPDGYCHQEPKTSWDPKMADEHINTVHVVRDWRVNLHPENFQAMLDLAAPRFEHILVYFPPIHAEALRVRLLGAPGDALQNYIVWKKRMIAIAARYPQVVLVDYQTINPYTIRNDYYWDFHHYRLKIYELIKEDFVSLMQFHRLAHPDFGQIADPSYGESFSPASFYFPRDFSGMGRKR